MLLAGCGGGGGVTTDPGTSITLAQRQQAATDTADHNASCTLIQPFYWEIGDRSVTLTGATAGGTAPNSATPMLVASASKWLFGAYLLQLRNGQLSTEDIQALTMRSGYTNLSYSACIFPLNRAQQDAETVDDCFHAANSSGTNADFDPTAVGKFFYDGGHFQKYADVNLGLGAKNNATLTASIAAQIGQDFSFSYDSPQLAAGVTTTAADYAFFLRKILSGQLLMHDYLGSNAVCTNPATCADALYSPVAPESWEYSLGHWVEDDPNVGDGSFSSPGAFGFYPWIDASKTYYGILARYSILPTASLYSVACGRKIRKAWLSGIAQ